MARGDIFPAERIDRCDETTGLLVRQVTSSPTPSFHLHYETPTFTPDGEYMLVLSQRGAKRGSPFDLFSMRVNGDDLRQLSSDAASGAGSVTMTTDGVYALYMEGATCHRTELRTGEDVELGHIEGGGHYMYDFGARTADGRYYFSMVKRNSKLAWVRWDLTTGAHDIVVEADMLNHPMANPGGPEVSIGARHLQDDGSYAYDPVQLDGTTLNRISYSFPPGPYGIAHGFWLGKTGKFQSTQLPPGRAVQVAERGATDVDIVAEGPYFWHSGASYDGEWIVADTNWPDEGLWLINVNTRRRQLLCFADASQGHPQWTHLHANLNDDGSMAVFDSDRTGITQVYVVEIPDEMRQELRSV